MIRDFFCWLKGGLEEDNGRASFGRISCAIVITFDMAWSTYLVYLDKKIPNQIETIALVGAIYGLNKVTDAIKNRNSS